MLDIPCCILAMNLEYKAHLPENLQLQICHHCQTHSCEVEDYTFFLLVDAINRGGINSDFCDSVIEMEIYSRVQMLGVSLFPKEKV